MRLITTAMYLGETCISHVQSLAMPRLSDEKTKRLTIQGPQAVELSLDVKQLLSSWWLWCADRSSWSCCCCTAAARSRSCCCTSAARCFAAWSCTASAASAVARSCTAWSCTAWSCTRCMLSTATLTWSLAAWSATATSSLCIASDQDECQQGTKHKHHLTNHYELLVRPRKIK